MTKLFSILLLCLCQSLCAATYYVATDGDDEGAGTIGDPWETLVESVQQLSAGDTLNIRAGTYSEALLDIITSGTSWNNATIIQAYNGETVRLNPTATSDVIRFQGDDTKYIVVNGLILDGQFINVNGCCVKGTYDVAGLPAHHIRVTNCVIENPNDGHCVLLSGGANYVNTYWEILDNDIWGSGYNTVGGSDDHGLYIHTGSNLIEGNEIYGCRGRSIQLYNNNPSSNIVRNNYVHHSPEGVFIYEGTNNQVYNNVFYNIGFTALALQALNSNRDTFFSFNTIYNCGSSIRLFCSPGHELGSIVVQNNLIAGQTNLTVGAISVEDDREGGATITIRNNVLSGAGLPGRIYEEEVELAIVSSNNLTNQASAGFASVTATNFSLRADSPAVNVGIAVAGITNDFLGNARFNPPDAGAFECYWALMGATTASVGSIRTP